MSLNNKFLISLSFISIFLFNTNIYSIFPSSELTDFTKFFNTESNEYLNLKKIDLEYNFTYYAPIIIDCDRRLGTNLNNEELVDIYVNYAINEKYSKFMDFYNNEKNKFNFCTSTFLKKAYQFLDLIEDDFDIENFITSLYFENFHLKNEEILIHIIDNILQVVLRNDEEKYRHYIEPISSLRNNILNNLTM